MTLREVAGLAAVNVLILGIGMGAVWMSRGLATWSEVLQTAGLSYFVGLSAYFVLMSAALIAGAPFAAWTVISMCVLIAAIFIVTGHCRRMALPEGIPRLLPLPRLSLVTAAWVSVFIVYFEVLLRASYGMPAWEWDAKWVWTIRAKALYFYGNLGGSDLVRGDVSNYESYPPGLSVTHALSFVGMGDVDPAALHVQHWVFVVAFATAVIGVLWARVDTRLLYPVVALCIAMPLFVAWSTMLQADLLLAFLGALAACLLLLFLEDGQPWRLMCSGVLMSGMMLTKREGLVLVAAIIAAALVASLRERRWAWPRILACGLASFIAAASWWLGGAALGGAAPSEGFLGVFAHVDRIIPALEMVVRVAVDQGWMAGMTVLVALTYMIALGFRSAQRERTFLAGTAIVLTVAVTLMLASEPRFEFVRESEISPVERSVLTCVVIMVPLVALTLHESLGLPRRTECSAMKSVSGVPASGVNSLVPWVVVLLSLIAYPALHLAG